MAKVTFKIGEAFPASDPVARLITVLGMTGNDSLRSAQEMLRNLSGPARPVVGR